MLRKRSVRTVMAVAVVLTLPALAPAGGPKPFPGVESRWNGFVRHDFELDGTKVIVVEPKQPLPGRPWAWRGEFFDAFPNADIELVNRGWHLAYISVPDLFGSPKAVAQWEKFHDALVHEHQLSPKPGLIGLSRGALYCMAWAAAHPDKTLAVYLDNGVCDFKSWPGGSPKGLGKGKGSAEEWAKLLGALGFASDRQAIESKLSPVDRLQPLAAAKIPILLVYGDKDHVVPHDENSEVIFDRYKALGGPVERIVKPGLDHHPHGLPDPTPIVAFFEKVRLASQMTETHPAAVDANGFRVGASDADITPPPGLPMWGYGPRHDMLSEGALDPLMAKAVVIAAGTDKVALVGIDLGRGPTEAMMKVIRQEIGEKAGIRNVLITGSHTHHGPVIELTDEPGLGKGKFDAAVAYSQKLPHLLVDVILAADKALRPAKIGVATESVTLNRNRHTRREPKATDPTLAVLRFDDEAGKPIAILVNFAAHPVMTDVKILKYSADYPAFLKNKVEAELATKCVFMQGAAGDMSTNAGQGPGGPKGFGETLADHVVALARSIKAEAPGRPSIKGMVDTFHFKTRVDLGDPRVVGAYEKAFFPEISRNYAKLFSQGLDAELDTVLVNGELALVGASGEFFCNHANRLRARSYVKHTLFFGYCNGHGMYFPTIEAASEGGYGADPGVSFAEVGAGERMMDKALINIYSLQGKLAK